MWRVEHPDDSQGPYWHAFDADSLAGRMCKAHEGDEWPDPFEEGHALRVPEVVGCTSSARLHDWFAGWWGELGTSGFTVRVFETPADDCTVLPSGQVVFVRGRAHVVYSCTPARFVEIVERRLVGVAS